MGDSCLRSRTGNVSSETNLPRPAVIDNFQAGKAAFERGQYREAVNRLVHARALATPASRLAGDIQLWLVTAYDAAGQRSESISLCRQLHTHPDTETRRQSRRLLYILEAPQLSLRPEWLTQIPDLGTIAESNPKDRRGSSLTTQTRPTRPQPSLTPVDLGQVDTQDNQFVWIALAGILVILMGLIWWS